jgi:hypothetical protein
LLRNTLSVIAGIIGGGVVVAVIESLSHRLWPPPAGIEGATREEMARFVSELPFPALLAVVFAWGVGAVGGGAIASMLAGSHPFRLAMIVGGVQMFFGVLNMILIPHPTWMLVAGLLVFMPGAAVGGHFGSLQRRPLS